MRTLASTRLSPAVKLLPVVLASMLASCGGGGGGASAPVASSSLTISFAADTLTGALGGDGAGLWDGSGGGGGADGGGGAGDGEFVQFHIDFTSLKFSWTVLRSEYGIAGQTGSLDLVKDSASFGGYRAATGPGAQQANIFVSRSGQVTGSIPLQVGGTTIYMAYNAVRYKDAVSTLAQVAGTYGIGALVRDANTGANPATSVGTLKLNADGSGRLCPETGYSDACANGFNVAIAYDNPSDPKLLKITSSDAHAMVGYGLGRTNDKGVQTAVMDISFVDDHGARKTGAIYAAKLSSINFVPSDYSGAWYYSVIDLGSGSRSTGTGRLSFKSDSTWKSQDTGGFDCANPQWFDSGVMGNATVYEPTAGSLGYINSSSPGGNPNPYILIPLSSDLLALVRKGDSTAGNHGNFGLLRRYSTDITKAPCF